MTSIKLHLGLHRAQGAPGDGSAGPGLAGVGESLRELELFF